MGKNICMKHVDDELEDIKPSCMWGLIHALHHHHGRHNVKRMLPQRKNQGRRDKGRGSPKARVLDHASGEMQTLLHEDETTFPVNQSTKESASINKRSLISRIKALIAYQTPKEGNGKHSNSRFSSRSRLERTYSIHHLEPPDHGFGEICTDWERPIMFFPGNEDTGGTKLQDPTRMNATENQDAGGDKFNKSSYKDASKDKLRKHSDIVETFKINKELFLEILQNADDGIRKFSRTIPASKANLRLTKSGSFPVTDLSHRRNLGPSKLKHKQSEIWSASRGEKFPVGTLMRMDVLDYSKNLLSRSGACEDNSSGTKLGRALSLILQSTIESDKEGHRDFFTASEKNSQAVYSEGIERRNEANSSLSDLGEVSNRQDRSTIEKDFGERSAESTMNRGGDKSSCRCHETDGIQFSNSTFSHRRSSSLNESLDKYALLFETNFAKQVKLHSSKSLRLSNENEIRSGKDASKLFTRIRSLSHLDEFYSSLQNVVQGNANFADWPIASVEETSSCDKDDTQPQLKPTCFSTSTEVNVGPDATQEPGYQSEMLERDDIQPVDNSAGWGENIAGEFSARMEDLPEQTDQIAVGKNNSYIDQESNNLEITKSKFPQPCPISASENFFPAKKCNFVEFQSAEGMESRHDHFDEDTSINWQNSINKASSSSLSSKPNLENINPEHMKDLRKIKHDKKGDTDLDYVRDLLERSGFTKEAFQWTWHSLDQPLNPSIFEEIEAYWHQELECSKDDLWSYYHHQLLFDLVNEELANLYDKSSTYYPRALLSSCHIRPFPVGNHLLEEISSSISSFMSLKLEKMQSLDSVVDLDLRKNGGWMNLQLESECLALELEDMIFDELAEELVCS